MDSGGRREEEEEAAGGGETSRNAELVFSATCLTVHVLYAADSAGQASATADIQQGVSACCESSELSKKSERRKFVYFTIFLYCVQTK